MSFNHLPRSIAAYDLRSGHWVYWNTTTQQFDLQELAPGYLITLLDSPFAHLLTDREAITP